MEIPRVRVPFNTARAQLDSTQGRLPPAGSPPIAPWGIGVSRRDLKRGKLTYVFTQPQIRPNASSGHTPPKAGSSSLSIDKGSHTATHKAWAAGQLGGEVASMEASLEDPWCEQRREPRRRPWHPLRHPSSGQKTQTLLPGCTQNVQHRRQLRGTAAASDTAQSAVHAAVLPRAVFFRVWGSVFWPLWQARVSVFPCFGAWPKPPCFRVSVFWTRPSLTAAP